jgi:L-fuculose-phosphate aldolase
MRVLNLKKDLILISHMVHKKGMVAGTDGNLSIKLSDNRFLITCSGINKGFITKDYLLIIDKSGKILKGKKGLKLTSEWKMHIKAYSLRSDINAVIHSHAPFSVSHSITNTKIPCDILPEVVMTIGSVPETKFSVPTSPDNAKIIEECVKKSDLTILKSHGVLSLGKDIFDAYNKLEKLEHLCLVNICSNTFGGAKKIPKVKMKELKTLGKKLGFLKTI